MERNPAKNLVNSAPGTDNTGSNAGFGQTLGLCEKVAPSNNPASGIWEKLGTSDMSDNLTWFFMVFLKTVLLQCVGIGHLKLCTI